MRRAVWLLSIVMLTAGPGELEAQYFGRNKVQYKTFDFEVLTTEHFEIYFYDAERNAAQMVARMAERWYARLSRVLGHELRGIQPLILYASHPDFRQTNAIPGEVGETTGGVTEALRRRIVLPMAGPLAETDHVLGHELVHAFQFDITTQGSGSSVFELPGALRLPLWFMEGMAEYLSVGPEDPHTAMWLRDALQTDHLPTVKQLADPRFFPYRYGQALWAYIAGEWGDPAVGEMLKAAGTAGDPTYAIRSVLGLTPEELSERWHESIRTEYGPILSASNPPEAFGRRVLGDDAGDLNVSPAVSPDGERIVFFSERDLFSIDMFVADVATGKILRRITNSATDPHVESLQFVSSTGTWSPDGEWFAFSGIVSGHPQITLIDPDTGDEVSRFPLPELGEVFNPTWSPDGGRIAFSAISGGLTDLYVLDLDSGEVRQLTDDPWAVLHPAWSPDGRTIAYVTDRFTSDLETLRFGEYDIALYDVETDEIRHLETRLQGKHINPQWSATGNSLYIVSDAGGISNLYRVDPESGDAAPVTNLATGVTGITSLSPALSVSSDEQVFVSVYREEGYRLYAVSIATTTLPEEITSRRPGVLPPSQRPAGVVTPYLASAEGGLPPRTELQARPYDPDISVDYVAPPSVSVGVSTFGSSFGGGTAIYWSDLLGDHNLVTAFDLSTDGTNFLRDISGVVGYENRKRRWSWGGAFGQTSYRSSVFEFGPDFDRETRFWETHRELVGTLAYPFSRAHRVEFSGGLRNISFAARQETFVFGPSGIEREVVDLPTEDPLYLGVAGSALVYDQTIFGGVGPVLGQRYRLEVTTTAGSLAYTTALADFRRYFMPFRPVTLAARLLHFGRYGGGAEDPRLRDLFAGDEYLIRGYDIGSFSSSECVATPTDPCPVFNQLYGSRIGVANLEARLPVLGPLGVASSGGIPVEISGFFDAATAWKAGESPSWLGGERDAVTSHGVTLRANLLGILIAQLSYVHPNDRPLKGWFWQFDFVQAF